MIGALTYAVYSLKEWMHQAGFGFPDFFFTALLVLIPVWVTGGIHLDGYLDTQDALHSYQSRERKLEILKDPHTGAFAVIAGICYFVLDLGIYSGLTAESVRVIAAGFVLSRALSGLSVVCFPQARKKGNGSGFLRWSEEEGKPSCADSLCDPGRRSDDLCRRRAGSVCCPGRRGCISSIMRG